MAGGWGAPITAPMMVPYNPPSQHIPVVVDKPSIKTVDNLKVVKPVQTCLLYTSPSPRDRQKSRMPSSA